MEIHREAHEQKISESTKESVLWEVKKSDWKETGYVNLIHIV